MKKKVYICKAEVNAMTKRVENSNNLKKIASSILEVANKENVELKAQVDELIAEVANLRQQLSQTREVVVNNYLAHFHEMTEYDSLGLY